MYLEQAPQRLTERLVDGGEGFEPRSARQRRQFERLFEEPLQSGPIGGVSGLLAQGRARGIDEQARENR